MSNPDNYYVPEYSKLPFFTAVALFLLGYGSINLVHGHYLGPISFGMGGVMIIVMFFAWFGSVIRESHQGLYNHKIDKSFRWGMVFFIFSEVMFFAAFFGALFYARVFSVPWLSGAGSEQLTHLLLWPNFTDHWPLFNNPDPNQFTGPKDVIQAWGIPAINTALLLASGVTLTYAHWALKDNRRGKLLLGMTLTILLGLVFLVLQGYEYYLTHTAYGLTIATGIYGTTFFMLTGFHGLHVLVGLIMLSVMWARCAKGHFSGDNHFAFEATAWYWHFVDVVWLILFVFVYWL